jgi:hypothetical protein
MLAEFGGMQKTTESQFQKSSRSPSRSCRQRKPTLRGAEFMQMQPQTAVKRGASGDNCQARRQRRIPSRQIPYFRRFWYFKDALSLLVAQKSRQLCRRHLRPIGTLRDRRLTRRVAAVSASLPQESCEPAAINLQKRRFLRGPSHNLKRYLETVKIDRISGPAHQGVALCPTPNSRRFSRTTIESQKLVESGTSRLRNVFRHTLVLTGFQCGLVEVETRSAKCSD